LLRITVQGRFDAPIDNVYPVEPGGLVKLGVRYDRQVGG
jgi:hypothetical protein